MLKTEFSKDVTVGYLTALHEDTGMTVEINDGQITAINFEEAN